VRKTLFETVEPLVTNILNGYGIKVIKQFSEFYHFHLALKSEHFISLNAFVFKELIANK